MRSTTGAMFVQFVTRPICPFCAQPELVAYRSGAIETDGSQTNRMLCKACGKRSAVCYELNRETPVQILDEST